VYQWHQLPSKRLADKEDDSTPELAVHQQAICEVCRVGFSISGTVAVLVRELGGTVPTRSADEDSDLSNEIEKLNKQHIFG
jgi:hypothetical protein